MILCDYFFTIETPPRDRTPLSISGHPVSTRRGENMLSNLDDNDEDPSADDDVEGEIEEEDDE